MEGKGVGGKRKVQSLKKGKRLTQKPLSKPNGGEKPTDEDDEIPTVKSFEVVHATSALIKPVSHNDHSSLITPSLKGQEVHVEVNMAHPWYIPFKQALNRWLQNG